MRVLFVMLLLLPFASRGWSQAAATPPAAGAFGAGVLLWNDHVVVGRGGGGIGSVYPSAGGVHLYRKANQEWTEAARLTAEDSKPGDQLGSALAAAGGAILVGAPGRLDGRGAVYVFTESGGAWRVAGRVEPASQPGSGAGASIAAVGSVAAVGAPASRGRGAVYLLRATGGTWRVGTRLVAPGDSAIDGFGAAVAIAGDLLVVGAPSADANRGAVHVFRMNETGATHEATLRRATAATGDRLGTAVAAGTDVVYAGAPGVAGSRGAVAVFRRTADGRWSAAAELAPPDSARGGRFGTAIARDGDHLVVGAPGTQGGGAAYEIAIPTTTFARLPASGTGPMGQLGSQVARAGGVIVVAAATADLMNGAVAVLERSNGTWRQSWLREPRSDALAALTGSELRCTDGKIDRFSCHDVDLAAFLPVSAIGGAPGVIVNDIWGWTDPETKREYALVGRSDGTAFVDLTDPSNPVYVGQLPLHDGATPNLWRDIKVYRDHAYIVADGAGPHGMQVFDLTRLRGVTRPPVTFDETAHYDRIASAHNVVINEETGFAFTVGNSGGGETCGGGLHMIDIREPRSPRFAGCFAHPNTGRTGTGYSHDAQCVVYRGPDDAWRGREVCFGANETALSIADVTDKSRPEPIASASYPNVAYTHQGWLSEDQRFFYLGDEQDEVAGQGAQTRTLVWDVSDLDDPVLVHEYRAPTRAIDHNQYVKGNLLYQSNLLAGLRILDISDPAKPKEVGWFDTVPSDDDLTGFGGSWSNYPYFRSGVVAVSSWSEGLFLLRKRERPVP